MPTLEELARIVPCNHCMGNGVLKVPGGLLDCPVCHGRGVVCHTTPASPEPKANESEALIQAECTKLLEEDDWRPLRTDPVSDRSKGKGFGELGMADMLYIRYAYSTFQSHCADAEQNAVARCRHSQVLWIEFKAPHGKPTSKQLEWHRNERARGALTWIAGVDFPSSIEGFKDWYRKSGLNRGRV